MRSRETEEGMKTNIKKLNSKKRKKELAAVNSIQRAQLIQLNKEESTQTSRKHETQYNQINTDNSTQDP